MRFEPKTDFSVVSALNSNSLLVKKKRGEIKLSSLVSDE